VLTTKLLIRISKPEFLKLCFGKPKEEENYPGI